MQNNSDWEECLQKIALLSPKRQRAVAWLIDNFEFAVKVCEATNLTQTQRDHLMKRARETDDTVMGLLLIFDKILKSD